MESDLTLWLKEFYEITEVKAAFGVIATTLVLWLTAKLKNLVAPADVKAPMSPEAQKLLELLHTSNDWKLDSEDRGTIRSDSFRITPKETRIYYPQIAVLPTSERTESLFAKRELKAIYAAASTVINNLTERKKAEDLAAKQKKLRDAVTSAESFRKLVAR